MIFKITCYKFLTRMCVTGANHPIGAQLKCYLHMEADSSQQIRYFFFYKL